MNLYRALNEYEIKNGLLLYPKSTKEFIAPLRLPFLLSNNTLGKTKVNAIREHQYDSKFPTRGVSTSLNKRIAIEKYGKDLGVIAIIDRNKLKEYNIEEIVVSEELDGFYILHPEDEEVILIYENDGPLPKEIIKDFIRIM